MVVLRATDGLHNPEFHNQIIVSFIRVNSDIIFLSLNEMQHHVKQHSLPNSNGEKPYFSGVLKDNDLFLFSLMSLLSLFLNPLPGCEKASEESQVRLPRVCPRVHTNGRVLI